MAGKLVCSLWALNMLVQDFLEATKVLKWLKEDYMIGYGRR